MIFSASINDRERLHIELPDDFAELTVSVVGAKILLGFRDRRIEVACPFDEMSFQKFIVERLAPALSRLTRP